MSTVYSSTGTQWPLLQSKTEQKFKSGLFNVSAEFIRPVGNTDLPTVIETSIGNVNVWPDPTVSTGTDGFERINATGYGVWDANAKEVVIGRQLGVVNPAFDFFPFCSSSGGCGYGIVQFPCGSHYSFPIPMRSTPKKCLFDTVFIKKIGPGVPTPPESLKIYDLAGIEITTTPIGISDFAPSFLSHIRGTPVAIFDPIPDVIIQYSTNLSQISQVTYGNIVETSATYEISNCFINFGSIYETPGDVICPE
jgi:hypothetical protein